MERIKIEEQELKDRGNGDIIVKLDQTTKKNVTYIIVGDELCPIDDKACDYCHDIVMKYKEERDALMDQIGKIMEYIDPFIRLGNMLEEIKKAEQ